ncbi:60S ribosomal protein L27, mitochondrial [Vermiconidia calcicola]|uniref:60S ribosomal protein L27, mitochondrial n=1 Tax=Vermiconidia calcicola TaxID=1690605 RepID=A0ACC3N2G0_9PEZI|nr:60S ribosomal protein L27, mitochondrial [Vermiconidia calcicola]
MQPTQPLFRALRRLALTTKQGPHNYYKGNRTGAMGRHTKYGGYIIDYAKVRTYVCPDLTDFSVAEGEVAAYGEWAADGREGVFEAVEGGGWEYLSHDSISGRHKMKGRAHLMREDEGLRPAWQYLLETAERGLVQSSHCAVAEQ